MRDACQPGPPVGDLWSTGSPTRIVTGWYRWTGVWCLGVALAIFFIDRVIHDFFPVNGLYGVVLYLTTRLSWPRYFWAGVVGCSGLILLDVLLAGTSQDPTSLYGIAGFGLLTLWMVAWILWTKVNESFQGKAREQVLEERLQCLSRELGMARIKVESSLKRRRESERALAALNHTLSQQNRELETIVSVASHDLRSPLVNVQGFGKELAKACAALRINVEREVPSEFKNREMTTLIEQEIPEALHYIQSGAQKMEALLQGVLRLSRLGRLTVQNERLDMNGMIAGIVAGMEFQLKEKSVTLQIDDLPSCLGDGVLINQLFCNLLDNAHKYMDPTRNGLIHLGGVREGEWVRYSVRDNGLGISKDHQEKIFHMFHRLNPSESRGDGLGLAIVKRIVDRHHGVIKVESFPGSGTTFTISLPAG